MLPAARAHRLGRAGLGAARPRRAHRQVPARHPGRLPRRLTAFRPATSAAPDRRTAPGSSRRWPRRPTGSARRRWRSPAPGCGTAPASPAPWSAPVTPPSCWDRLLPRTSRCRRRSRAALDDVSSGTRGRDVGDAGPDPASRRSAAVADTFAEFCASGLWPGVGGALADAMPGHGITGPAQVTVETLTATAPGDADARRAAAHRLDRRRAAVRGGGTAGPAGHPGALGGPADRRRSATTPRQILRRDPWRLLVLPDATVGAGRRVWPGRLEPEMRATTRAAAGPWSTGPWPGSPGTATPPRRWPWWRTRCARSGSRPESALAAAAERGEMWPACSIRPAIRRAVGAPGICCARRSPTSPTGMQRLIGSPRRWPATGPSRRPPSELDTVQGGAVTLAAAHGVSLLTGGPGTGKSRTVSAIVALCRKVDVSMALAAPDRPGRQAPRGAGRASGDDGAPAARRPPRSGRPTTAAFDHDALNPLEAGLVVVDEASMLDVELAAALVNAHSRRHPSGGGRRPGAAAVDRAGPGARRPDRLRRRPGHRTRDPVPAVGGRHHRPVGHRGPRRRTAGGRRPDQGGRGGAVPRVRRRLRTGSSSWSPTRFRGCSRSPATRCRWSRRCTAARPAPRRSTGR